MILSDRDIKRALKTGRIQIKPRPILKVQLGSCSIDLRLGRRFGILNHSKFAFVDPRNPEPAKEILKEVLVKKGDPFVLQPGDFTLASTIDSVRFARVAGRARPRGQRPKGKIQGKFELMIF